MQGEPPAERLNQKSPISLYPTEYNYNNPINSYQLLLRLKLLQLRTPQVARNPNRPTATKRAN